MVATQARAQATQAQARVTEKRAVRARQPCGAAWQTAKRSRVHRNVRRVLYVPLSVPVPVQFPLPAQIPIRLGAQPQRCVPTVRVV